MRCGLASIVACLLAFQSGCSSSSTEPTPSSGASFSKDVVPILAARCATDACHGNVQNKVGVHFITSDPASVYAELQKTSPTAAGAKLVVPGDPEKSFRFAKIEGAQDDFTDTCTVPGCGETMPPGTKLGGEQRATIRTWIEQGAKND